MAPSAARTPSHGQAGRGTTLLMYTDGLVEDRDVPVGGGLERLAAAFLGGARQRGGGLRERAAGDGPGQLARRRHRRARAAVIDLGDGRVDLACRRRTPCRSSGPSCPGARTRRRRAADGHAALTEAGLRELVDTAALLVSEVVTNALRHGGGPEELVIEIDAEGVSVGVGTARPQPPREEPAPVPAPSG